MRVLFIHCFYKYKGGEDTVVFEEMKLLNDNGITAELLNFNNEKHTLLNLLQLPFNIGAYKKTLNRIKEFKPDIIHIHNLHFAASPSVVYAIKKSKVPFVMTLHNYRLICPSALLLNNNKPFLYSLQQKFPWTAVKYKVYKNSALITFWLSISIKWHQYKGTWQHCKKFVVLNRYAQKIFEHSSVNAGKNKFIVKPNFCAAPHVSITKKQTDFLFVGRLSEEKGIHILLDVFALNNLTINIAGDGPLLSKVIEYAEKYNNIQYLGKLDKQQVFQQMINCNALIFPSIWPEGMPLTIIEALACGAPIITPKSGAMLDMITDNYNGLYFELGNATDLNKKINEWQQFSEDKKNAFRENALNTYYKNYTPEKNYKQLMLIYKAATGEHEHINVYVNKAITIA